MLLSHTKLVLGNSLIDIRSSNYFSIIPTILLVELRIINDPDKYLDEFVEIIRSNGDLNFELFNKENLIIFGEFLWFKFIKEFQKMNTYQKSYCFWRYQEYIEDEITHGLVGSFNLEKNNETDFELGYTFDDYFNLSEIYGSSSKTLREKTIKKFMKRSQKNDIFYPKLDDNSITRLKQLIDFQFDFFKKNVYHSKEETHFKLSTNFKILNHPTLGEFQGIYELSGKGLWRIHKNKFLRIGVDFSLDLNDKIAICKKHSILCFGGIPKVYDINYSDIAVIHFDSNKIIEMKELAKNLGITRTMVGTMDGSLNRNQRYYNFENALNSYGNVGLDISEFDSSIGVSYYQSDFSTGTSYYQSDYSRNHSTNTSNLISDDDAWFRNTNHFSERVSAFEKQKVKPKVKKKRKIDSKFIKSYNFLRNILSIENIKEMRKNGIIIEGIHFNYKFKVNDNDLIEYSKNLNNFSIRYELTVLNKENTPITDLCIVYPGMPIFDEISTNILFIRSGEEDIILEKANHISKENNYSLYFEKKKRITPERRFEIEFEKLLKEEEKSKVIKTESDSISYFNSKRETYLSGFNDIVADYDRGKKFKIEIDKRNQTISFIKKIIFKEKGIVPLTYDYNKMSKYYMFKTYKKYFKSVTRFNPKKVFDFEESLLFKDDIKKNLYNFKQKQKKEIKKKIKNIRKTGKIKMKDNKWNWQTRLKKKLKQNVAS